MVSYEAHDDVWKVYALTDDFRLHGTIANSTSETTDARPALVLALDILLFRSVFTDVSDSFETDIGVLVTWCIVLFEPLGSIDDKWI